MILIPRLFNKQCKYDETKRVGEEEPKTAFEILPLSNANDTRKFIASGIAARPSIFHWDCAGRLIHQAN